MGKYTKAIYIYYKYINGKKIPVIFESRFVATIDIPYGRYFLI